MGLARSNCHPPRGHGTEDIASIIGECASTVWRLQGGEPFLTQLFVALVWGKVVVPPCMCGWWGFQHLAVDGCKSRRFCYWRGRCAVLWA